MHCSHHAPRDAAQKLVSRQTVVRLVRQAKARRKRVVFTNGCFDLLHPGHVMLLERAKRHGDLLIVGMNSDRSVRALKGASRPVVTQRDRALVVAGLASVDYVTTFDEATPQRLIALLRPHVLVKGADWGAARIVGADVVERAGGKVVRVPLRRGYSTTRLIQRLVRRHAA